ncbi:MAG TPA: FtsW/RodA/SpoVE family cell cycle protein, partial [Tepidisphaeraceae bacterium]|nr:FtsW/RodA/SpoVE family cell cycle protein [Tepidisphaeraceae bacterium]
MESLRTWHLLTLAVVALLGFGVVMVDSASMSLSGTPSFSWRDAGFKQVVFAGLAIVAFTLASRIQIGWLTTPLTPLRDSKNSLLSFLFTPAAWSMIGATLLCLLVLTPLGTSVNGASRWIRFGPIQIQPSELAKWSMILWLAAWLAEPPV